MPQFCPQCQFDVPGPPAAVGDCIHCPRCRAEFAVAVVADQLNHTVLPIARTGHTTQSNNSSDSNGRTQLMGGVRLLSLPAELEGLRGESAYETLSHASITPKPRAHVALSGLSSVPGVVAPEPGQLEHVPGFRIEGVIGHGGMGSVYLARQLSLDRSVALKVMSKAWASDPVFVARFIREAYAAAQLNHPNVVQIYDIGEFDGNRYFSMEYVVGSSLADVLKKRGKLDPEVAVGFILQAARGLKHAHDRGIIHRDIKPDNLLLDEHGTVKVADLGLVKTPELTRFQDRLAESEQSGLHSLPPNMTGVRMALGTPAYMAPEQCRDASTVDSRADIYSLGCTLYALVTGTQPFIAKSAFSLMKKHAYEAPVPAEQLNPRLSQTLAAVIHKMMSKHPGDRYASMAEVIRVLEQWLGIQSVGVPYSPRDDQVLEVERLVAEFGNNPTALLRERLIGSAVSGSALAAVLLLFFGQVQWAFGLAGLVVQSALAYFVLNGHTRQTYLFRRIKQFVRGMSRGDWIVAVGISVLFFAFMWMTKLLLLWAGFGLIAVAVAGAVWYFLDRKVYAERRKTASAITHLVKQLRKEGATTEDVRLFFAKHSGRRWEEFFEFAFGFEAKLETRNLLMRGGSAGIREKFAAWREPLVNLLNAVDTIRKNARERELIERAEFDRLMAAGIPSHRAKRIAEERTDSMIDRGGSLRLGDSLPDSRQCTQASQSMICLEASQTRRDYVEILVALLLGSPLRAILAALLIAASALWYIQNELWHPREYGSTEPLAINGLPLKWTYWCDSVSVGWGAILLLGSLMYRGHRMAAFATLGAAIAAFGPKLGIRTVEPIQDYHVAMLLGTVLALIGYRLGRR